MIRRVPFDPMFLATLVGLICNFRQERGAQEALSHRQFAEWLAEHRFQELSDQIATTYHLQSEVDALLREDHAAMMAKLGNIEEMLATLLSRVPGFDQLARKVHPEWELSEQAVDVLRQFVESGSVLMLTLEGPNAVTEFGFLQKNTSTVQFYIPHEPGFFADDLEMLCGLGLIALDIHSGRDPQYQLTRAGKRYITALPPRQEPTGG